MHLCKLACTKTCRPLQRNLVPTTVMFNPSLMGLTFFALSSFPASCQTCHSLSQQRVGAGGACCASCLELHLLLSLLGLKAINFCKVQNTTIHCERTQSPVASALLLTPSLLYIISHTLNPFLGKQLPRVRVTSHLIAVSALYLFTLLFYQLLI